VTGLQAATPGIAAQSSRETKDMSVFGWKRSEYFWGHPASCSEGTGGYSLVENRPEFKLKRLVSILGLV